MKKNLLGKFVVVGLHPAIDRTLQVPALRPGGVIRGKLLMVQAGGKATNVTLSLANFGNTVTLCGILGQNDISYFLSALQGERIQPQFVAIPGNTRQNITLIDERGVDTHITSGGMCVSRSEARQVRDMVTASAEQGDWVVFTGSRPEGFTLADYKKTLSATHKKGAALVIDADGDMLAVALKSKPWLIKPNRAEIQRLTGKKYRSTKHVITAARNLLDTCEMVLLSLGADGAALVTHEGSWQSRDTAHLQVEHTVGCGDALLAGFLSAYASGSPPPEALRFGVACGSDSVENRVNAIRSISNIRRRLRGVVVEPA